MLYVRLYQPPPNALKIYVVAKQWMWKTEYPGGQREINALHVPVEHAGGAGDDVAGRDPRFLRPRLPREARRLARPVRDPVVHAPTGPAPITCSARSSAARATPRMIGSVT